MLFLQVALRILLPLALVVPSTLMAVIHPLGILSLSVAVMVFFDLARQHQADLVGVEEILVELVVQELLVRDIMEQVAQVEAQKYLAAAAVLVGQDWLLLQVTGVAG